MSFINVQQVVHFYHKHLPSGDRIFRLGPLSFSLEKGELLTVLGPSGSGKSTLLKAITGLERIYSGSISLEGRTLSGKGRHVAPEQRRLGMVFQDHALFPHLTVGANVCFGIRAWPRTKQKGRLAELLDLLGLTPLEHRLPYTLSGGQQQRVALARTLASKPSLILLDEPLSNIDVDLRGKLAKNIRDIIHLEKMTAIWVTHDQVEAFDVADRVLVLKDGKIEQLDTPWDLYNKPRTRFIADFVGEAVFLPGEVVDGVVTTELGRFRRPDSTHVPSGKKIEVMVRPESVRAVPYSSGLGTITDRKFQGFRQLYTITLPSKQNVLTYQSSMTVWPLGTRVQIAIDPEDIIILEND